MSEFDHKQRHEELHSGLDELIADFISHTGKIPSETTLLEFMEWSYAESQAPTEEGRPRMNLAYIEEYHTQSEDWEMLDFLLRKIHAAIGLERYDLMGEVGMEEMVPSQTGEWISYNDLISILKEETPADGK